MLRRDFPLFSRWMDWSLARGEGGGADVRLMSDCSGAFVRDKIFVIRFLQRQIFYRISDL